MHSVALCRQHREKEREREPPSSLIYFSTSFYLFSFSAGSAVDLFFIFSRERAGRGIKNDASVELIGLFGRRFRWPLHIHKLENEPKKTGQVYFCFVFLLR
jgi:hypothetical protein